MLCYKKFDKHPYMMKYFFKAIFFAYFVAVVVNASVKPTEISDAKKCYVNNVNNFYAGPNCKNITQQLTEIKELIMAMLKRNQTGNKTGKGLYVLLNVYRTSDLPQVWHV